MYIICQSLINLAELKAIFLSGITRGANRRLCPSTSLPAWTTSSITSIIDRSKTILVCWELFRKTYGNFLDAFDILRRRYADGASWSSLPLLISMSLAIPFEYLKISFSTSPGTPTSGAGISWTRPPLPILLEWGVDIPQCIIDQVSSDGMDRIFSVFTAYMESGRWVIDEPPKALCVLVNVTG